MNKVYYFTDKTGEYGGTYIAAPNFKKAKKYALKSDIILFMDLDNPFVDIRGSLCRCPRNGKIPITCEFEGELDIKQINDLDLAWWYCNKCGYDDFEIIDDSNYKCRQCGFIGAIPYVDL